MRAELEGLVRLVSRAAKSGEGPTSLGTLRGAQEAEGEPLVRRVESKGLTRRIYWRVADDALLSPLDVTWADVVGGDIAVELVLLEGAYGLVDVESARLDADAEENPWRWVL